MSILGAFMGTLRSVRVALVGGVQSDTTVTPTACNVSWILTNTGLEQVSTTNGGTSTIGNWITPTALAGAGYEARATLVTGTLSTGTTGVWTALSSTQTWTVTRSTVGTKSCTFTLEIRNATSLVVLASQSVQIDANQSL